MQEYFNIDLFLRVVITNNDEQVNATLRQIYKYQLKKYGMVTIHFLRFSLDLLSMDLPVSKLPTVVLTTA